ncbi:MAG: hypothetical protein ACR2QC_04235 [Gammaproteobacteria bacterium]
MTEEKTLSLEDEIAATLDDLDKTEDDETEEASEEASEEVVETEEETEESEEAEEEEPLAAPDHWPTAERELFTGLPKEAQQAVLDRSSALERSHHERLRQNENQVRLAEDIERLYEPVMSRMQLNGLTIPQVTAQLLQTYQVLLSDPGKAYGLLGQSYRPQNPDQVLRGLATAWNVQLQQEDAEEMLDPVANQRFQQLEAQLNNISNHLSQGQVQAQTTQQQDAQRIWDDFVNTKDEKGQLKYPHVEKVQTDIAASLRSGVTSLEEAYERALWSNPDLRAKQLEAQRANDEAKRKESVKKAKKAGKNPKSDPAPASAEKPTPKNLRETIEAAVNEVEARA